VPSGTINPRWPIRRELTDSDTGQPLGDFTKVKPWPSQLPTRNPRFRLDQDALIPCYESNENP